MSICIHLHHTPSIHKLSHCHIFAFRSKNLDILFKREYYEQRIATQKQLSEDLNKTASKTTEKDSADCTPATATNEI